MDKDHKEPLKGGLGSDHASQATVPRAAQLEAIKIVLSEANVRAEVLEATAAKIAVILWGQPKP